MSSKKSIGKYTTDEEEERKLAWLQVKLRRYNKWRDGDGPFPVSLPIVIDQCSKIHTKDGFIKFVETHRRVILRYRRKSVFLPFVNRLDKVLKD